jgi:hypothetical protein
MSQMKERTKDLVRLVGYQPEDSWLGELIETHLARASNDEDEQLDYESVALQAVPMSIEMLGSPCEEDLPTTDTVVACHLVGLFHTPVWGPAVGGVIDRRSYVLDLNEATPTVFPATYDDEGPRSVERYVVLPDGRPEALADVARRWMEVQQLEVTDPAKHGDAVRGFIERYPGLARSQRLLERSRVTPPGPVAAVPPMPATLEAALEGALLLAPLLSEHGGLPPRASAPEVAAEVQARLGVVGEGPHRESALRIRAIAGWLGSGGSETLSEFSDAATQPISRRWLERLRQSQ